MCVCARVCVCVCVCVCVRTRWCMKLMSLLTDWLNLAVMSALSCGRSSVHLSECFCARHLCAIVGECCSVQFKAGKKLYQLGGRQYMLKGHFALCFVLFK